MCVLFSSDQKQLSPAGHRTGGTLQKLLENWTDLWSVFVSSRTICSSVNHTKPTL